jgi:pimeloyl-ACP methyl ester carboxylesterase
VATASEAFRWLTSRPVRPGEVHAPGDRGLRWVEAGDGPPVVLVGGAGEVNLTWTPVFGALAERSRTIAYDRAGLGTSDPAPAVTALGQADDLGALLDEVGPAVLVGHSWGGLVVQVTAWQHPRNVAGLVLVDSAHEEIRVPLRLRVLSRAMFAGATALHRLHLSGRVLGKMGRDLADVTTDDPEVAAVVASAYAASYASRSQFSMIVTENRMADTSRSWLRPLRARAALPDVPVVVLAGTKKPNWLRDQALDLHRAVAAAAPRGEYVEVDAGHYIHHERPEAVVEAVERVLAV